MNSQKEKCLLCLATDRGTIKFHSDTGKELNIIGILCTHFGFQLDEIKKLTQNICYECWHKTESFHEFYQSVRATYKKFETVFVKVENDQAEDEEVQAEREIEDHINIIESVKIEKVEEIEDVIENEVSKDDEEIPEIQCTNSIDTETRGYKCDVCEKSFARKESYTNHHLWHTGKSPHKCYVCGKMYTRKIILENHQKSHSSESNVPKIIKATFSCDYCPKIFTRKQYLKAHISIHTKESQFKCLDCGKLFTRKEHLISHSRTHTGETPFECKLCSMQFTNKKSLKAHLDRKCRIPSLTCYICSKSFTKQSSVTNHINRSHSTNGNFKCKECDKCFVVEMNLLFHMKSHKF